MKTLSKTFTPHNYHIANKTSNNISCVQRQDGYNISSQRIKYNNQEYLVHMHPTTHSSFWRIIVRKVHKYKKTKKQNGKVNKQIKWNVEARTSRPSLALMRVLEEYKKKYWVYINKKILIINKKILNIYKQKNKILRY